MCLTTPVAILIGSILAATIIVTGAKCLGQSIWPAFAAIGTIAAVVWAVYHQELSVFFKEPVLEISFFESQKLHLVQQVGVSIEKDGEKEFNGLFISILLTNIGKTVAKDTQPLLSNVYCRDSNNNWKSKENWIALPLRWVLGERALNRDLLPKRPYYFNLGSFSKIRKGMFYYDYVMAPKSQRDTIDSGEYYFEITIYALGAKVCRKFIYVNFENFSSASNLQEIMTYIKEVEMKDVDEVPF